MFSPKRSRWPPLFLAFLAIVYYYLSWWQVLKKFCAWELLGAHFLKFIVTVVTLTRPVPRIHRRGAVASIGYWAHLRIKRSEFKQMSGDILKLCCVIGKTLNSHSASLHPGYKRVPATEPSDELVWEDAHGLYCKYPGALHTIPYTFSTRNC